MHVVAGLGGGVHRGGVVAGTLAIAVIEGRTDEVVSTVNDISLALKEQSLASNDIALRIEHIAQSASDNATAVDAAAQASHDMHAVAASLQTSVRGFQT
jgi:methyl-accepting chemotaxis protein